ncbi:Uncharacterized protein HII31_13731 [Pseudocercospora fuligena]|uniref:XPG N-terminal domain-containing protein n=1 Tax=Pseudocercospora fuligena TaxID=685502 RepID=A0A8H6VE76_9PEZI|nr:Uncharacterized protein HII31_13731 [Pseudocercospora fuligena]
MLPPEFKDWASKKGLIQKSKISDFDTATIGFDAEAYINNLLSNANTREPLLPALGGLPFALTQHIDAELARLREANITPWFVFNGIEMAPRDRKTLLKEGQKAVKVLETAWEVYDQGRGDDAVANFGKICTYRTSHILRFFRYYLHKQGVMTTTAPYSAAAQLNYMDEGEKDNLVSNVAGSVSCLVANVDKLVVELDWNDGHFRLIDRDRMLSMLMLTHSQFVDLMLLSGHSMLAPIPEIDNDTSASKITAAEAVLNRANMDGYTACLQAKDEEYTRLFMKAKTAIKHMVVLHQNGKIEQLNYDSSPNDIHEVLSQRLPDEALTYLQHGIIGPRVLNWRTRSEILELPPLDGGFSPTYKELVRDKLRPLKTRLLAIISHRIHRYFQKKDVELVCWWNETDRQGLGVTEVQLDTCTRDAESWHVKDSLIAQAAVGKDIDNEVTPLEWAITLLSDDSWAKKTVTRRKDNEPNVLKTRNEILANTLWRFLQDRGYINSDHTLSAWGKALKAAFEKGKSDQWLGQTDPPQEAEEAIFIAFELLRLDVLSTKNLFPSPQYSGAPMRGTDQDKANTLLISRIASLGSFSHARIGYTGPLSRHLLAYHQITAAVRNTLRDLAETHAANMMLSASAVRVRPDGEYTSIGAALPFLKEPDLGLALVVKSHLDELSNNPERRSDIRKWFNHALDIDGDLKRAWKMWDAINAGIQAADSAIVSSDTRDMFQNVDIWLQAKRLEATKLTNATNGTNGTG